MTRQIEFYYDFGSPNAYLVEQVLPALAARHGATVLRCPILLGGVFKAIGNRATALTAAEIPGKLDYLHTELQRFVARHRIGFRWTPHFPIISTKLMRGALFAEGKPWEAHYRDTVYRGCWVDGANMSEAETARSVLAAAGLPADEILAAADTPEIKADLRARTEAAVARRIFGVPTMFLGDEMFFGKDALNDLDWRLSGSA